MYGAGLLPALIKLRGDKMAKIRMKATAASPDGTYEEGKEYPENKITKKYVEAGYAVYTENSEDKRENNIETAESERETEDIYPKATGGGWYELSNGKKIQGKEEAIKAEKDLG
jgi:hypothetical protein